MKTETNQETMIKTSKVDKKKQTSKRKHRHTLTPIPIKEKTMKQCMIKEKRKVRSRRNGDSKSFSVLI